jgi:hypothetical protein
LGDDHNSNGNNYPSNDEFNGHDELPITIIGVTQEKSGEFSPGGEVIGVLLGWLDPSCGCAEYVQELSLQVTQID